MSSRIRLAVLGGLLWASTGLATTMLREDVPELSRSSDAVVRGKVLSTEGRWTSDHLKIFTVIEVQVEEAFKGRPPKVVTVVQPGGHVDDIAQSISGLASFEKGEEVVVFLRKRGDKAYAVNGLGQGKYRVEKGDDGKTVYARPQDLGDAVLLDRDTKQQVSSGHRPIKLDELRSQVKASVDNAPSQP